MFKKFINRDRKVWNYGMDVMELYVIVAYLFRGIALQ